MHCENMLLLQPEPNIWLISTVTTWLLRVFIHLPRKQSQYLACGKWFVDFSVQRWNGWGFIAAYFAGLQLHPVTSRASPQKYLQGHLIHPSVLRLLTHSDGDTRPPRPPVLQNWNLKLLLTQRLISSVHLADSTPCVLKLPYSLRPAYRLPLTLVQPWVIFQLVCSVPEALA